MSGWQHFTLVGRAQRKICLADDRDVEEEADEGVIMRRNPRVENP